MQTPQRFIFESFALDKASRTITLRYSFDEKTMFSETLPLPASIPVEHADSPDVQRALFALHLAGGVSYYKAFCPHEIVVRSGELNKQQADFWNEFYTKGLGEFFFVNSIDFHGLVNFPATGEGQQLLQTTIPQPLQRALLPFGGGKDSIISLEALQKAGITPTLFRLRRHHYIDQLVKLTGLPMITVERQLDPQLFALNAQGAYNGHVPITGFISFLSIMTALLGGYDGVVFSNERSADYGNVEYLGMQVNHQWSKGMEAEQLMRQYIAGFVTNKVQYLNPLRPLSELRITRLFAAFPRYFTHTTSCNQNWRMLDTHPDQPAWCGHCYKCCFIFALYAAELPDDTAVHMFGKNLFADETLLHTYRQLWGAEGIKPFDCVGTPEEMQAAMYLALKKPLFADTIIGKDFAKNIRWPEPEALVHDVLQPNFEGVTTASARIIKGLL